MTKDTGRFRGETLDGVAVMNGYVRSAYSGWLVVAGTPVAVLDAPLKRMLWPLAATAFVGWAIATILALAYSRTFTRPLRRLQAMAAAGVRDEPPAPVETPVLEVNVLSQALANAFARIIGHARDQTLLAREFSQPSVEKQPLHSAGDRHAQRQAGEVGRPISKKVSPIVSPRWRARTIC